MMANRAGSFSQPNVGSEGNKNENEIWVLIFFLSKV